jgi:eukaryotic-like serine/threonine-protein kinase
MALAPGVRLGAYEVSALIGAGGMGEVYRAHDTTLNRGVALKVLPELFAADPDRLARFRREAQTLASLNHPHIAAIYGFESSTGVSGFNRTLHALVLELVEGPTLADRLIHGPLSLDEALQVARQIAQALEAAHDKSVVHRDLKPANIKITPQGVVKVLDFGLAKATGGDGSVPDLTQSPTVTGTRAGVILGTAAYMSPEQARGQSVDKRADIWAFGCALFEMLTGRAPFARDTLTDTLAAIVDREPSWQSLPPATPDRIRDLLRRCLQKDPSRRLRDIGDARLEIEDAIGTPKGTGIEVAASGRRSTAVAWFVAGLIVAGMIIATLLFVPRQPEVPATDLTLTIAPPSSSGIQPIETGLAIPEISPDGSFVAYHDRSGTLQLRRLNALSTEPLPAASGLAKVWSPDSSSLWFADNSTLKRIPVPDGAPEVVGKLPAPFAAATVSESGVLLFVCCPTGGFRLFIVPRAGVEAEEAQVPGLKGGAYRSVSFLPGGEDVLVTFTPQGAEEADIYLVTLRDGKPAEPTLLMRNQTEPRYTPARGGRLLFVRNDNLYAQTLNRRTRRLEGDPELVQQGVSSRGRNAHFSVSHSGIVVWRPGRAVLAQVTIFDRRGTPLGTAGPPMADNGSLRLSPDEQRVLVTARDGRAWLLEANQPGRFNVSRGDLSMLWSRDGSGFLVPQESRIVERQFSGTSDGRELARLPDLARLEDVSADGNVVLFGNSASTLSFVRLDGTLEKRVATVVQTSEPVGNARFSPDGRWIVYQRRQQVAGIWVQPFPGPGLPKQIASTGESAVWRKDGQEILYLDRDQIWSVRVDTSGGELRASAPERLFAVRSLEGGRRVNGISQIAVSRDGSHIYYQQPVEQPDSDVIHVRMGWGADPRP